MAKKKVEQNNEQSLLKVIGNILTSNVNLTTEEYNKILAEAGLKPADVEKVNEQDRLTRIKANYYGTSINMLFSILQSISVLTEEISVYRAIAQRVCKKLDIRIEDIKTSQDRVNEATERYLKAKTKAMEKTNKED